MRCTSVSWEVEGAEVRSFTNNSFLHADAITSGGADARGNASSALGGCGAVYFGNANVVGGTGGGLASSDRRDAERAEAIEEVVDVFRVRKRHGERSPHPLGNGPACGGGTFVAGAWQRRAATGRNSHRHQCTWQRRLGVAVLVWPVELGHSGANVDALWLLQAIPRGRCPHLGGGWPRRDRTSWRGKACTDCRRSASDLGAAYCHQPAELAHCGALAYALWLLQIIPRGRCPHLGGGWPRRNRASWRVWTSGGRGCACDARDDVVDIHTLQLEPLAEARHSLERRGHWKRDDGFLDIVMVDLIAFTSAAAFADGNLYFRPPPAKRYLWHAHRGAAGDNRPQRGRIITHSSDNDYWTDSYDLDVFFVWAATFLLSLHAVAVGGAMLVTASRSGEDLVPGVSRPNNKEDSHSWRIRRSTKAKAGRASLRTSASARCAVGEGRWVLAARHIAGRRYRKARGRRIARAIMLGRPWTPWRSAEEAEAWEDWWIDREGERGRAVRGAPVNPGGGDGGSECACDERTLTAHAACPVATRRGGSLPTARAGLRSGARTRARLPVAQRLVIFVALFVALADCRIGEAANPGPELGAAVRTEVKATWIEEASRGQAVVYPQPNRDGFRDVASPGFEQQDRRSDDQKEEDFALVAETVNSTGWGPLRRRLLSTCSHLVLAQETWVLPCQQREASDWATRHGWESVWAPAQLGVGGGASGGAAILARRGLGLRFPTVGPHVIEEARAVAAVVEPPGHRPILAVSAYLIDGKGVQPANRAILAKIGRCVEMQGADALTLVGGDFQCAPADVDGSGFTTMIKGKVVAAPSGRGTFRTSRAATSIDFFVASDDLAGVVDEVKLIETSGVKGHTPVQLSFRPRAVALKALAVRPPPEPPHRPRHRPHPSSSLLARGSARGGCSPQNS